jgi:peptidoglycan-N-acetylglucosamine deacetylase
MIRRFGPALWLSFGVHLTLLLAWVANVAPWGWLLAILILNHVILFAGMRPGSRILGPDMRQLPDAAIRRGEVALTFDDGPDPVVTPQVLDLLDAAGARASFFCIGTAARAYPELLRDIARRGHSVENHTDRHALHFAAYGIGAMRREILAAQATLLAAGRRPQFFRAPFGLRSPFLAPAIAGLGLTYLSWTRRALDGTRGDAERGLARLTRGLAAGDILLMHDGRCARDLAGRAVVLTILPRLLDALAQRGLRSVSLPMALRAAPAEGRHQAQMHPAQPDIVPQIAEVGDAALRR